VESNFSLTNKPLSHLLPPPTRLEVRVIHQWLSTVVGRKAALDPAELPFPPVIGALRPPQHPDAITFSKGQIPRSLTSEIIASRNKQAIGWWWRRRLLLPGYGTGGRGGGGGGGVRSISVEMVSPRGRGRICWGRARPRIRGHFGGFGNARGGGGASRTGRDDHRTRGGGIAEPWVDRWLRGTVAAGRLGRRTTTAPRPRTRMARTTSAASIAAIIPPHRLPDGPPPLGQTAETFDIMLDGPKIGLPLLDHLVHRGRR